MKQSSRSGFESKKIAGDDKKLRFFRTAGSLEKSLQVAGIEPRVMSQLMSYESTLLTIRPPLQLKHLRAELSELGRRESAIRPDISIFSSQKNRAPLACSTISLFGFDEQEKNLSWLKQPIFDLERC